MASIANLSVKLTANISAFSAGMAAATKPLRTLGSQVASVGSKIGVVAGALAALAAGGSLVALFHSAMEGMDATGKLSDRLGIATEKLVGLQHAAKLSGISNEEFTGALEKMLKSLGEATTQGGPAAETLARLGLNARQLANLTPDQAFGRIADALNAIQNPAERAMVTMDIFGKSGQALGPLLAEGSAGLAAMQADAEKLGLTFSRVDAAQVEAANDAVERLKAVVVGVAQKFALQLAPYIEAAANALTDFATEGEGMGGIVLTVVETLAQAVAFLCDGWKLLKVAQKAVWVGIVGDIDIVLTAIQGVADGITWLINQMKGMARYLVDLLAKVPGMGKAAEALKGAIGGDLKTILPEEFRSLKNIVEQEGLAAVEDLQNEWNSDWPHDKVSAFFEGIRNGSRKAAEATVKAKKPLAQIGEEAVASFKKVQEVLADLQKQVDQFGMTDSQRKLADLTALGATPEQLAKAKALLDQLDALNAAKKKADELAQEGKSIFEATRTPLEKYESQIDKLGELLHAGVIDWDTYGRAVRQAREELENATKVEPPPAPAAPEAMKAGSAQAQRYVYDLTLGQQRLTKDDVVRQQLAEQKDANRILDRIERNTAGGGAGVTIVDI